MKSVPVLILAALSLISSYAATVILDDGTVVTDVDADSFTTVGPAGLPDVTMLGDEACLMISGTLEGFTIRRGGREFEGEYSLDANCGFFEDPVPLQSFSGRADLQFQNLATEFVSIYAHIVPEPAVLWFFGIFALGLALRRSKGLVLSVATAVMLLPQAEAGLFDIDGNRFNALPKALPPTTSKAKSAWSKIDFSGVSIGSRTITLIQSPTRTQRFGVTAKHYSTAWRVGRGVPFLDRNGKQVQLVIDAARHIQGADITVVRFRREIPPTIARYALLSKRVKLSNTPLIHVNQKNQIYVGSTATTTFGLKRVSDYRPYNFLMWWDIVSKPHGTRFVEDPFYKGRGGYRPVNGDSGSPLFFTSGGRRGKFYLSLVGTFTTPGSAANYQNAAVRTRIDGAMVALSK